MRYFLFQYHFVVKDKTTSKSKGNYSGVGIHLYHGEHMPSYSLLVEEISSKQRLFEEQNFQCIITSFQEFKSKEDYESFYGARLDDWKPEVIQEPSLDLNSISLSSKFAFEYSKLIKDAECEVIKKPEIHVLEAAGYNIISMQPNYPFESILGYQSWEDIEWFGFAETIGSYSAAFLLKDHSIDVLEIQINPSIFKVLGKQAFIEKIGKKIKEYVA